MDQENTFIHGDINIHYPVDGKEDGFGYIKISEGANAGLIIIQEIWGLNKTMVSKADKFASQGFTVISPDIYRGKQPKTMDEARHIRSGIDWNTAILEVKGAALYLNSLGIKKVGVLGFCYGGALSIASICSLPDLIQAAAPFYGLPDLNEFSIGNIKGPIFGHFGELDHAKGFSAPEDAKKLEEEGKKFNKNVVIKIWEGAKHAFMNPDRPEYYNPEVSEKAFAQVIQFFKNELQQ